MKRVLIFLLVLSLIFLIGCSGNNNNPNSNEEENEPIEGQNDIEEQVEKKKGSLYIHYILNNGKKDVTEKITSIDEYDFLEPTKEGYYFDGWYTDIDYTYELEKSDLVLPTDENDIIVMAYADWTIEQFLVKFMRDGYLMTSQLVKYGSAAKEPNPPLKPGYRFVGWDKDFSCIKEETIVNAIYIENNESKNIMVVLGNRMNDNGTISETMRKRLELALKAYSEFKFDYIVVSGGLANAAAGITEAQAMYNYLVEHGIDRNIIIKEDQSYSTQQNATYTMNKLENIDFKNLFIVSTIEHFLSYGALQYFNTAANNNAKIKAKNINIIVYTNND